MEILAQVFQPSVLSAVTSFSPLDLAKAVGYYFLWFYALWILYLAVMNLMRAKEAGKLSKTAYVLGLPVAAVGILVDVFCNILLSIAFLEVPKQWTVTRHLSDNLDSAGYKGAIARFICKGLLDTFDPHGCHCERNSRAP